MPFPRTLTRQYALVTARRRTKRREWTIWLLLAAGLAVVALLAFDAWSSTSVSDKPCTAEGRIGQNGQTYGRDPDHDCKFVDEHGNVLPGQ